MKTLEEIRAFFAKDLFATENGAVIDEVGHHYAKVSLTLTERHRNAVGNVMGGVHFMLADFAFGVATNWEEPGPVSISSSIVYMNPVKGDHLTAEAICLKHGRSTCTYRIDVTDGITAVAAVTITGFCKS